MRELEVDIELITIFLVLSCKLLFNVFQILRLIYAIKKINK